MDKGITNTADVTALATSRRGFFAVGAAAALPSAAFATEAAGAEVMEQSVSAAGFGGGREAALFRPLGGEHPGLVVWATPSAATRAVARRLAGQGWAVLLVPPPSSNGSALHREARGIVDWLVRQDGISPAGPAERSGHGLGHGYTLRTVSAAQPRLSLADRAERARAASSAWLVAAPQSAVIGQTARLEQLATAVRSAFQAGALAA